MVEYIIQAFGFLLTAGVAVALIWLPLSWRSALTLRRRFFIKADIEKVWQAISLTPGDVQWHPHLKRIEAVDGEDAVVRLFHELQSPDGRSPTWSFDMSLEADPLSHSLTAQRVDLGDTPSDDRLLQMSVSLAERAGVTVVDWHEVWGRRSLAGRFMAYSDADRALSQLKSYCETGKVCSRSARSAGSALSLFSAFITVAAFALLIGWQLALLLAAVLVVHEVGHLISFRMVGQPWGRVMFVPFIGGVAVSRMRHQRLSEDVFCALMGAGLSIVLLLPAFLIYLSEGSVSAGGNGYETMAVTCAALAGVINLINLLPIFPLDGGRVMRATFQSIAPNHVPHWMYAIAGLIGGGALITQNSILAALAAIAFFQSRRLGPPAAGMKTMTPAAILMLGSFYAGLLAAHGTAFWLFGSALTG
ncbi:MAG: site-2 protease family protein [Aestuariivirgaceae bacterium]